MDAVTPAADFSRLMQYGAVGVVAAGLLTLVVVIFRQLVNHALEQNKALQEQIRSMHKENQETHQAYLRALHAVEGAIAAIRVEVTRDIGQLFNEFSAYTEGSRAHRGPRRGGGAG